jgi:hypothetical protein
VILTGFWVSSLEYLLSFGLLPEGAGLEILWLPTFFFKRNQYTRPDRKTEQEQHRQQTAHISTSVMVG